MDLRHTPSVEALCRTLLQTLPRLDFVVHNACQTVRRPAGFYRHLWARERTALELLPAAERAALRACAGVADPVQLSQVELLPEEERAEALFPAGAYDCDQQQVDLRAVNSWRLELADVSSTEVIETHLCNAVAPFVINGMLKPLMRGGAGDRHIVNVSAMEGQFYRLFKARLLGVHAFCFNSLSSRVSSMLFLCRDLRACVYVCVRLRSLRCKDGVLFLEIERGRVVLSFFFFRLLSFRLLLTSPIVSGVWLCSCLTCCSRRAAVSGSSLVFAGNSTAQIRTPTWPRPVST